MAASSHSGFGPKIGRALRRTAAAAAPTMAVLSVLVIAMFMVSCKKGSGTIAVDPDVWATVNGESIHRGQVQKYYDSRANPQTQPRSQDEALSLTLNILDELINNDILLQRAKQLGLEASDGEVEDKFTELKAPFTEDEFQKQMKDRGITVDDLKQDIRSQVSVQKLIDREVMSKITITDKDISDFYNQNRSQFNVTETQYRIAQIVVTPVKDPQIRNRKNDDATTDIEARRKIAALAQKVAAGQDFGTLAMDYSEDPGSTASGGDLGFVPESSLNQSDPALKNAVLALRPGQVSGVIALRDGYRILKLLAKEVPGQRELSDPQVQQSIRDTLRNRKEQLLRTAYLATVRDQAKVNNYLADQVMESDGKLPEVLRVTPQAASSLNVPVTPGAPPNTSSSTPASGNPSDAATR